MPSFSWFASFWSGKKNTQLNILAQPSAQTGSPPSQSTTAGPHSSASNHRQTTHGGPSTSASKGPSSSAPARSSKRPSSFTSQCDPTKRSRINGSPNIALAASAPVPPISNISAPDTPIFGNRVPGTFPSTPTPVPNPDVDMADASYPTPPPSERSTPPPGAANDTTPTTKDESSSKNASVESDTEDDTAIHPKKQPIPQAKRKHYPQYNPLSEITYEVDDGTGNLPKGYCGTWRGLRFGDMEHDPEAAGCMTSGTHQLSCGHWIHDGCTALMICRGESYPCGMNCRNKPYVFEEPFHCQQCCDLINDAIVNKATDFERRKLKTAMVHGARQFELGFRIELAMKYSGLKANVTETLMGMMDKTYGDGSYSRKCTIGERPEPGPHYTLEETVTMIHESKMKEKFERENKGKKGSKRKDFPEYEPEPMDEAEDEEEQNQNHEGDFSERTQTQDTNKHGKASAEYQQSQGFTSNTNKQAPHNRSYYRATNPSQLFPSKCPRVGPAVEFGAASFHNPPAGVVGAITRKRKISLADLHISDTNSDTAPNTTEDGAEVYGVYRGHEKKTRMSGPVRRDASDVPTFGPSNNAGQTPGYAARKFVDEAQKWVPRDEVLGKKKKVRFMFAEMGDCWDDDDL